MDTPLVSTASLIQQVKGGDHAAKNTLFELYLPMLRRWTRGRLPVYARTNYVAQALSEAMGGKTVRKASSQPYGCSVKY